MLGKLWRYDYDFVEEVYDSKFLVYNEDVFEYGIVFKVKVV